MVSFAGIDRKVAVEIITFSADELRTRGVSVNAGKGCTLPAVSPASCSLAILLRGQRLPLVSHNKSLY